MTWKQPTEVTPVAGRYVVKTKSVFKEIKRQNIFECDVSYSTDKKGKIHQHWSCNNQIVVEYLDENKN